MERIKWNDVTLYDEDGNEVRDEDIRREALAEYRREGSITGYWFVNPNEYDEPWTVAPEIDWTGFEE